MAEIDKRRDELLEECERIDEEEREEGSWVKREKELADNEEYRNRIREVLKRFEEEEEKGEKPKTINRTDTESSLMRSVQGSHASYNVQSVVDDKQGLTVPSDAGSDRSDVNQSPFSRGHVCEPCYSGGDGYGKGMCGWMCRCWIC